MTAHVGDPGGRSSGAETGGTRPTGAIPILCRECRLTPEPTIRKFDSRRVARRLNFGRSAPLQLILVVKIKRLVPKPGTAASAQKQTYCSACRSAGYATATTPVSISGSSTRSISARRMCGCMFTEASVLKASAEFRGHLI